MRDICQDAARFSDVSQIFKALGHPLRVQIVCGLLEQPCTQTQIAACLGVPQSTIAQHLEVLRRRGIVEGRRSGTEVILEVVDSRIAPLLRAVCPEGGKLPAVEWKRSA